MRVECLSTAKIGITLESSDIYLKGEGLACSFDSGASSHMKQDESLIEDILTAGDQNSWISTETSLRKPFSLL